jgi:RHS repeat protein
MTVIPIPFSCRHAKTLVVVGVVGLFGVLSPGSANAYAYGYDSVGRLSTALYDNGLCVVYAYDAAGNRLSQTNTISSAPESPVWGSGQWGCFSWTLQ